MSFDTTNIILEIVVTDSEETSKVIAFYHHPTGDKLDWGFEGSWLEYFEAFHCHKAILPKENGHYKMRADWNDTSEAIESIWDIQKLADIKNINPHKEMITDVQGKKLI